MWIFTGSCGNLYIFFFVNLTTLYLFQKSFNWAPESRVLWNIQWQKRFGIILFLIWINLTFFRLLFPWLYFWHLVSISRLLLLLNKVPYSNDFEFFDIIFNVKLLNTQYYIQDIWSQDINIILIKIWIKEDSGQVLCISRRMYIYVNI